MSGVLPHLDVVCAVIERDGRALAARRGPGMSLPGKWEFPGGKIREGEAPDEALGRELAEELSLRVRVIRSLPPRTHRYPSFAVTLRPFVCAIGRGVEPVLAEHSEARWVAPGEMASLDWAEADLPVVTDYLESLPGEREGGEVRFSAGRLSD